MAAAYAEKDALLNQLQMDNRLILLIRLLLSLGHCFLVTSILVWLADNVVVEIHTNA